MMNSFHLQISGLTFSLENDPTSFSALVVVDDDVTLWSGLEPAAPRVRETDAPTTSRRGFPLYGSVPLQSLF